MFEKIKTQAPAIVTGASGFLGHHLIRALLDRGRKVVAISNSPSRIGVPSNTELTVVPSRWQDEGWRPKWIEHESTIFHLGSARAVVGTSRLDYQSNNVDATLRLARMACRAGIKKYIYVSTALIFGSRENGVAGDESLDASSTSDPYLQSKIEAAIQMQKLQREGYNISILCPSIIYGPDHPFRPNRITTQIRRLLKYRIAAVIDRGRVPREMTYVDDIVDALLTAEREPPSEFPIILGGESVTHEEFIKQVFDLAGSKPLLKVSIPRRAAYNAASFLDIRRKLAGDYSHRNALDMLTQPWIFNSSVASRTLAYQPRSFVEGLQLTLDWLYSRIGDTH